MSEIGRRLGLVRTEIAEEAEAAGRPRDAITLVAVSKSMPVESIQDAYDAGQRDFGENRVQEGAAKIATLSAGMPGARWHLIGRLQANKVKPAIEAFGVVESVDSLRLAERIDRLAATLRPSIPVLLEVNVAGEEAKAGFDLDGLREVFPQLIALPHLDLRGLMTVAPLVGEPEEVRGVFRALRELRDELRDRYPLTGFEELSMGMSNDFRIAIQEGATMVRIGRAIFGERPVAKG